MNFDPMRTKYSQAYETFWKNWPGRWREGNSPKKVGKAEAYEVWLTMDTEDRQDALSVLRKVKDAGTQYLPDCYRWLKLRRWEDFER